MNKPATNSRGRCRSPRTSATASANCTRCMVLATSIARLDATAKPPAATSTYSNSPVNSATVTGSTKPYKASDVCITPPATPSSHSPTTSRRYNTQPTSPTPQTKPAPTTASPTPTTPSTNTTTPADT